MATHEPRGNREDPLTANRGSRREKEINILLLGETGVGKSTFINAFANYITNDTHQEAANDEVQTIIPSSFSLLDPETFEEKRIIIGEQDDYEQIEHGGQSGTQACRSFMFPIGDRVLRFIDTPGLGYTRGAEQDCKTFQEILDYISQFEHLNAVFILLKPNEQRINVFLRFSINELFRHLYVHIRNNLVFVFTNARSTFFRPDYSMSILRQLFNKYREEHNIDVPFSRANTFLFDNETFRFLALRKNGVQLDNEQIQDYAVSWNHSVNECSRLMEYVASCSLHHVRDTLTLNEAEQLVRKLSRPIAETNKLIEENIQLAKEQKKKVLDNPQIASQGILQKDAVIVPLKYPKTLCISETCCRVTGEGEDKKVKYLSICHEKCFLKGVQQETLAEPLLKECEVMNSEKGFCTVCHCSCREHKHITYEYDTRLSYLDSNTTNKEFSLEKIDERISDLRKEQTQIQDIYKQLARFLHADSILPIDDVYIDYLQYFIREEQMKQKAGAQNLEIISNLEMLMNDYITEMKVFHKTLTDGTQANNDSEILQSEAVFTLVGVLYDLPINGKQIRAQVDAIQIGQTQYITESEVYISLPAKAASSKLMLNLKDIFSSK